MTSRKRITVALGALIALILVGWLIRTVTSDESKTNTSPATTVSATSEAVSGNSGQRDTPLSRLPIEAAATWRLIQSGGPFPYPHKDGTEFRNSERRLPPKAKGYYREYTVPTPGERTRGARRLVTGQSAELYYTADHYVTFVKVDPSR